MCFAVSYRNPSAPQAIQSLKNAITVSNDNPSVSTYGSDKPGISLATSSVVDAAVESYGYDPVQISKSINKAIDAGTSAMITSSIIFVVVELERR